MVVSVLFSIPQNSTATISMLLKPCQPALSLALGVRGLQSRLAVQVKNSQAMVLKSLKRLDTSLALKVSTINRVPPEIAQTQLDLDLHLPPLSTKRT